MTEPTGATRLIVCDLVSIWYRATILHEPGRTLTNREIRDAILTETLDGQPVEIDYGGEVDRETEQTYSIRRVIDAPGVVDDEPIWNADSGLEPDEPGPGY